MSNASQKLKILGGIFDLEKVKNDIKKLEEQTFEVDFWNRKDSQDILKEKTGVAKIPTVFYNDGKELHTMLIEFPNVVADAINKNPNNYDEIKYNFRIGKFNLDIEKELVNYLISL